MKRKNWIEWLVFALGVVLVGGVVGVLGYDAVAGGEQPADLRVRLGAPAGRSGQVLVPVRVENEGDAAAEEVTVEVCLRAEPETCAEVAFPYVPRRSSREGHVGFGPDAAAGAFTARVVSYREP